MITGVGAGVIYKDAYLGLLVTILAFALEGAAVTALKIAALILLCIYGVAYGTIELARGALNLTPDRQLPSPPKNLSTLFNSHKPTDEQAKAIHDFIKQNMAGLKSADGVIVGNSTLSFTDGRDFISYEEFDSTKPKEWCLLKTGESKQGTEFKYDLVRPETAVSLIKNKRHPIFPRLLEQDDFPRGNAVLTLLDGRKELIVMPGSIRPVMLRPG